MRRSSPLLFPFLCLLEAADTGVGGMTEIWGGGQILVEVEQLYFK